MSNRWKEKSKIMVIILVIVAMLVGAIPLTQPIESQATDAQAISEVNHGITNGDFESEDEGNQVTGWTLTAMKNGLTIETDSTNIENYLKAYDFVTTEKADGNRIASLTKKSGGYVAMTSEIFAVEGGTPYRISYDYCVERIINKRESLTNVDFQGISIMIHEIKANNAVTVTKLDNNGYGRALIATDDYTEVTENGVTYHTYESTSWNTVTKEFCPAPDTIAAQLYIRVGAKGKVTGTVLLDNVLIDEYGMYDVPNGDFSSTTHEAEGGRAEWSVADTGAITEPSGVAGWTSVSTNANGKDSDSNNYQNNYTATVAYEAGNAVMKYTYTEEAENKASGYAWILSPSIVVEAGKRVSASYRYKITGKMMQNAKSAIFFYDENGNELSRVRTTGLGTGELGWTTKTTTETEVPADATYAKVGFYIGRKKGTGDDYPIPVGSNYYDEFTLYFDDVVMTRSIKDSPLYEKKALFTGATAGSDIAAFAQSYSEMKVTDVCNNQEAITEQLINNAAGTYDYLFLNIGKEELEVGLEQVFANVALYYDQLKVVCLLTADNAEYQATAEAAAAKWNVTMVPMGAYESAEMRWQETIEPAEEAAAFDCYEIAGFGTYLTDLFRNMEAAGVSVTTDMNTLEAILAKAKNCPNTDEDYQMLSSLVSDVEQFIAQFDNLRPELRGATIALNDPNQLQFLGIAPKQELTVGVTVKQMGIAVTDGNSSPIQLNAAYTNAGEAYGVLMDVKDVDPSVSYTAVAYIIYEADGKEYLYYSNNDYVNTVGEKTVEDGECTKSVYEIARKVALKLAAREGTDFSAIGGAKNKNLIATATTESKISLHNVYQMLGKNVDNLIVWLSGGGVAR